MNLTRSLVIRPLQASDEKVLSVLIREMSAAFSAMEVGHGDSEKDAARICGFYLSLPAVGYWVLENRETGQLLAGAGLLPRKRLKPEAGVGELRDLLLHPSLYGAGAVKDLAEYVLNRALEQGYKLIYLERLTESLFNQDSGLRFFRSGRTVRYTHLTPD